MKIPAWTKPALWGAVVGSALTFIIGFAWGDWYTAGGVRQKVEKALTEAMLPVCADRFLALPAEVIAKYKAANYNRDDVVREHLKMVGPITVDYSFARACAEAINKRPQMAAAR